MKHLVFLRGDQSVGEDDVEAVVKEWESGLFADSADGSVDECGGAAGCFKILGGCSYQGLLDEARGAMARHLLQHERWSVERVADALGYSESAAFSRAFSRWMGVSPLSYKNDSALRISDGG